MARQPNSDLSRIMVPLCGEFYMQGDTMSKKYITTICLISVGIFLSALIPFALAWDVGLGADDWWIDYPDQSPIAGSPVDHPRWLLQALDDGPVLVYVHRECNYCAPQQAAVDAALGEFGREYAYYDIKGDGSDSRAVDLLLYDPNGGSSMVPLTIILTLVPGPNGDVQVGWHSSEEITGEEWLISYMEDGLRYHEENSGDWSQ